MVVGARFLLPLLIPRFPLPAIVACLVLDGVDQSIFQAFGYDPPGYQGYDKAMDVYYLAIAYLATMRNWAAGAPSGGAVPLLLPARRGRGLRAHSRRGRCCWSSPTRSSTSSSPTRPCARAGTRCGSYAAGGSSWPALIWIFIKLPQEYWIHVAQLDVTDTLAEYDWAWPLLIALIVVARRRALVRRTPAAAASRTGRCACAADPLPEEMDTAAERAAWRADARAVRSGGHRSRRSCSSACSRSIFAQTLPGVDASNLELFVGTAAFVVVNAALVLAAARRAVSIESLFVAFGVRLVVNVVLVVAAWRLLLGRRRPRHRATTLFFVMLLSLITTLHDAWQPVHAHRVRTTPPRWGKSTTDRATALDTVSAPVPPSIA